MEQIKKINISHVEATAMDLAQKTMTWDEPIPPFSTRFPNKLESCVETPFATYGGRELYPGLARKAAVLFYLIIKNHPFENGNKRIAITTLLVFLFLNQKWLKIDPQELYNLAKWVAGSPPGVMDGMVNTLEELIGRLIIDAK